MNDLPSISVIIPTLNSERALKECLESLLIQDYPLDLLEILIIDAGSGDGTLAIAEHCSQKSGMDIRFFSNPLKTGEAGKAVGVKNAKNDIAAFIDSDNILPDPEWFHKMVAPFRDNKIIATEPWKYTYRSMDGYINRYCALLGMNDPLCLFMGNYDRYCLLTKRWTDTPVHTRDREDYLEVRITGRSIPTIGANGFLIRKDLLSSLDFGDYLFDVDVLAMLLKNMGSVYIGKVKTGIIHLYCSDFKTFFRKQKRRVIDYYSHTGNDRRPYAWDGKKKRGILLFIASCLTIFPLFTQSLTGLYRKYDPSWFFHPLACVATLYVYALFTTARLLGFDSALSRHNWSQ